MTISITMMRRMALWCLFGLSMAVCNAHAEDVLYVRDGSVVKGTIIEIVEGRTVKIRSPKGRVFVYRVIDIKNMDIDPSSRAAVTRREAPAEEDTTARPFAAHEKWSVAIGGGLALPVGSFGSTDGPDAGLATIGWTAVVDGSINLMPSVDIVTSGVIAVNGLSFYQLRAEDYVVLGDVGTWKSIWALSGVKIYGAAAPDVELYGMGQAGLFFGLSPATDTSPDTRSPSTSSSGSFGFGLSFGGRTRGVDLSVRYLHAAAEYGPVKIYGQMTKWWWSDSRIRTVGGKPGQPIGCVTFNCALVF